jgi:hypothetical protein
MHNLVSHNELASWKWDEKNTLDDQYNQVSEYFQCISECDIVDQQARRFCRHILTEN